MRRYFTVNVNVRGIYYVCANPICFQHFCSSLKICISIQREHCRMDTFMNNHKFLYFLCIDGCSFFCVCDRYMGNAINISECEFYTRIIASSWHVNLNDSLAKLMVIYGKFLQKLMTTFNILYALSLLKRYKLRVKRINYIWKFKLNQYFR